MTTAMSREEAIGKLRAALAVPSAGFVRMVAAAPSVHARFQPVFKAQNLPKLTKEEFQSFLLFKNNNHWIGLHRKGPEICSDMKRLRTALAVLVDESRPIQIRLDELQPGGRAAVSGMGKAILTSILLVMYPDHYGVWNNTSQGAMEILGLWPRFERGESLGRRYAKVNATIIDLARELGTNLWTLDGLWWSAFRDDVAVNEEEAGETEPIADGSVDSPGIGVQRFGLERHLHDFLRDNWEKTSLGQEWSLHSEDGEVVGYEYPTPIGRIDLLAKHKKRDAWLVVELKRNQSSDDTVGQALRYMGFVREHVAAKSERVEGLIVSHVGDDKIRYALSMMPDLSLMLYEVDFRLTASHRNPSDKVCALA